MTSNEFERRLSELLAARGHATESFLSGPQLRAMAGERDGVDRFERDVPGASAPELIGGGRAARGRRRSIVATGAGLAAAAAAIVGIAFTPAHRDTPGGATPAGGGQSASGRTSAAGRFTLVHETLADGAGSYQDVWIPTDPTNGVWRLKRKDASGTITQNARCAEFPFFDGPAKTSGVGVPPVSGGRSTVSSHPPATLDSVLACTASGGWDGPYRPPFAESLPSDPATLLADMRAHSSSGSDADTFVLGSDFIGAGWVPTDVTNHVVAALELIPGVVVTRNVPNGVGATGTAISFTGEVKPGVQETWGVIVDPSDGAVIGSTLRLRNGSTKVAGITRTVVDALGATR